MISIKAIGISAALITSVASGLALANQNFTIAGGDNSNLDEQVNQKVPTSNSASNIQLLAQNPSDDKNKDDKQNKDGKEKDKKVPTPALLPGLVALGIGVMRKRKTQESKVNE